MDFGGGGSIVLSQNGGFTLAEVLITLGIIGIVAAITLPSLITKKQTKELQVGLQKGYSLISQVMQLMEYGEGQPITPETYASHKFAPVFDKYLVSAKACNDVCLIIRQDESDENGTSIGFDFADYKTYNKRAKVAGNLMDNGQFLLRNGMTIYMENETLTYISIDVNGMYKGPNLWGHDLFTFQLMNNGKMLPMGAEGTNYNSDKFCSPSSTSKYNGIACTNKALTDSDYWNNLP